MLPKNPNAATQKPNPKSLTSGWLIAAFLTDVVRFENAADCVPTLLYLGSSLSQPYVNSPDRLIDVRGATWQGHLVIYKLCLCHMKENVYHERYNIPFAHLELYTHNVSASRSNAANFNRCQECHIEIEVHCHLQPIRHLRHDSNLLLLFLCHGHCVSLTILPIIHYFQ